MEIIRVNTDSPWYKKSLEFRNKYLREPLGLNIFNEDLHEQDQIHFLALEKGAIIGVVLWVPSQDNISAKLRQMATSQRYRGRGVGVALVKALEELSLGKGIQTIRLHAREHAVGFYEKLGYQICSDKFLEIGVPHFEMQKQILAHID